MGDSADVTVCWVNSRASRRAVWAWVSAGLLWALVWFHGTQTHGLTAENEMRVWLGATWMDSSKLLCLSLAAVGVGLYLLGRNAGIGRTGRWLWVSLLLAVTMQAVAVLVGYSPFPWGSYELTFEELQESDRYRAVVSTSGIAQALGSLINTVLFLPVGIALVRAQRVPWWAVPAAVIGMLFTFFTTPASWIPAVSWLLVAAGVALRRRSSRGRGQTRPR